MALNKVTLTAEIVGALLVLLVMEWFASLVTTRGKSFWAIVLYVVIYLAIRAALLMKKRTTLATRRAD